MQAEQTSIKEYVEADGFTTDTEGNPVSVDDGYFVSLTNNMVTLDTVDHEFLHLCRSANKLSRATYIGGWANEFYLDLSVHVDCLLVAQAIAETFGQSAIYDCKNSDTILL